MTHPLTEDVRAAKIANFVSPAKTNQLRECTFNLRRRSGLEEPQVSAMPPIFVTSRRMGILQTPTRYISLSK